MNSRMRFTLGIVIILAVAMLGFSPQAQGQAIKMEYNKEIGKTVKYKTGGSGESTMDHPMGTMDVTQESEGEALFKVSATDANSITFELSFTKLTTSGENSMVGSQSSENEESLNKPLILKTGHRGQDPDLTNIKDLPESGEGQGPVAVGLVGLVIELAANPVNVNDTWPSKQELAIELSSGTVNVESDYTYTFAGLETKAGFECMKITGKGTTKTTGTMNAQGMDMDLDVTEQGEVTAYFAYKEGFFVEINGTSSSETVIDIPAAGASITGTGTSKNSITIVK